MAPTTAGVAYIERSAYSARGGSCRAAGGPQVARVCQVGGRAHVLRGTSARPGPGVGRGQG